MPGRSWMLWHGLTGACGWTGIPTLGGAGQHIHLVPCKCDEFSLLCAVMTLHPSWDQLFGSCNSHSIVLKRDDNQRWWVWVSVWYCCYCHFSSSKRHGGSCLLLLHIFFTIISIDAHHVLYSIVLLAPGCATWTLPLEVQWCLGKAGKDCSAAPPHLSTGPSVHRRGVKWSPPTRSAELPIVSSCWEVTEQPWWACGPWPYNQFVIPQFQADRILTFMMISTRQYVTEHVF